MLNREPQWDTSYSTKEMSSAGRRENVRALLCETCNEVFDNKAALDTHQKASHRPGA